MFFKIQILIIILVYISVATAVSCKDRNCVRKCCPKGMIRGKKCQLIKDGRQDWLPSLSNFRLLYGSPKLPNNKSSCNKYDLSMVQLQPNGKLLFDNRFTISPDHYCMDYGISEKNEVYDLVVACYEENHYSDFEVRMKSVARDALIASCCFLFILVILHTFIAEMRKEEHELIFFSMCIALFYAFLSMILIRVQTIIDSLPNAVCVALGIFVQYFNLSFNFWLNVRCYETFRIIRGTVKAIPISVLNSSKHRFMKYSAWAWGVPLIISTVTLILQQFPYEQISFHPKIGHGKCWFSEKFLILGVYYYGYQLVLHILNICFLATCFFLLQKSGAINCCKKAMSKESRTFNKQGLNMFWQQFCIFFIYILLLSLDTLTFVSKGETFWLYVDVLNCLQGVYLTVIFLMCKKGRRKFMMKAANKIPESAKTLSTSITNTLQRKQTSRKLSDSNRDVANNTALQEIDATTDSSKQGHNSYGTT